MHGERIKKINLVVWLQAGRSRDRIPVGARFSAPVRTGPGVHPVSCTMDTGSFPGVKSGRGVTLTPHSLLVPWSRKGRAIPLLPLWAVRPVQSLSVCTRVHFTFTFTMCRRTCTGHSSASIIQATSLTA
jgi:DNA-binding transcriptional LysR family regulator